MRTLACRSGSLGLALAAGVAAVIIVTATPASAQSMEDVEARLLELLNAERRAAGIDELERASDLVAIASDWSQVMAGTREIRHNPDLEEQMCCHVQWAENVAYGSVPDGWLMESTEGVHRNLMRSTTHRANILDPAFDQVGIGAVLSEGILWVTQDFRRHAEGDEPTAEPVAEWTGVKATSQEESPSDPLTMASSEDEPDAPTSTPSTTPEPAPTSSPGDDITRSVVDVASRGTNGTVGLSEMDSVLPTAVPERDMTIGLVLFVGLAVQRWARTGA